MVGNTGPGGSDPKAAREAHYKTKIAGLDGQIRVAEATLTSARAVFENTPEANNGVAWDSARRAVASAEAQLERLRRDREHMVDMRDNP